MRDYLERLEEIAGDKIYVDRKKAIEIVREYQPEDWAIVIEILLAGRIHEPYAYLMYLREKIPMAKERSYRIFSSYELLEIYAMRVSEKAIEVRQYIMKRIERQNTMLKILGDKAVVYEMEKTSEGSKLTEVEKPKETKPPDEFYT